MFVVLVLAGGKNSWMPHVLLSDILIVVPIISWNVVLQGAAGIHGVSRLYGITAGGDFLGFCDQKSSYKHVSDFGRLRSYDRFLIPVHALVWTASNSWCVMY